MKPEPPGLERWAMISHPATESDLRVAPEGSWQGDGSSAADLPEEELLAGFGG
jgi:hypothetical protein